MWKARELGVAVDALLQKLQLSYPPNPSEFGNIQLPPPVPPNEETSKEFPVKEYDITQWPEFICSCTTQHIKLEEDEMVFTWSAGPGGVCQHQTIKEPYAQMGSVEVEEIMFCCYSVDTDSANI